MPPGSHFSTKDQLQAPPGLTNQVDPTTRRMILGGQHPCLVRPPAPDEGPPSIQFFTKSILKC